MSNALDKHVTPLRILDWMRDGWFPALGKRPTRSEILGALGEPQRRGAGKASATLWCYGAVEFHFARDGALKLIHVDNFATSSALVDLWILPRRPTVSELERELLGFGIEVEDFEVPEGTGRRLSSGVELYFDARNMLHAVSQRFDVSRRRRQISVELDEHHLERLRSWSAATQRSMSNLLSEVARAALELQHTGATSMTSIDLGYGVRISLGVFAFQQSLSEVEALLGRSDGGWSRGTSSAARVHQETYWVIHGPKYVGPVECEDAHEQVLELLERAEAKLALAVATHDDWVVELTIVGLIRSSADWPGMSLAPSTVARLAALGARVDVDVILSA